MTYRLLFLALFGVLNLSAAPRPKLIVNIVVGSMRAEAADRYMDNFSQDGFRRLFANGLYYENAHYDFQQTTTPVALATLTTGAMPSTHGVVTTRWRDYVANQVIELIGPSEAYSPEQLVAPTLGEALLTESPESHVVSIALDASSAIVMAGRAGEVYWLDSSHCQWTTAPYYAGEVPFWVREQNREKFNLSFLSPSWTTLLSRDCYHNNRTFGITLTNPKEKAAKAKKHDPKARLHFKDDYRRMCYTPAGNSAVLAFAKNAVAQNRMGSDKAPDVLNICLDASRYITEVYGPESVEVEDMYYRLDNDLSDFLTFLLAQCKEQEIIVTLTADHGTSPSYDAGSKPRDRFNPRQFEVIVNSFLNIRYGMGEWILDYQDKCIYLNHNLIYEKKLDLAEVQNEVAIFCMQFRGVSHALTSTAMRTSYFGSGYARRMQNSFYPRRSGDVMVNLMPGWIEEQEHVWSVAGSLYGYDSQVPLVFFGYGVAPQRVMRAVDMTSVAPTLARQLKIATPAASEGTILEEVTPKDK